MRSIDGNLVANGTTRLRVQVTKADIEKGTPMDPNSCAIAVACRRLGLADDVYIHRGTAFLLRRGKWERRVVPRYARDEIVAFDRGGKFVPQEIELLPPPVSQLAKVIRAQSPRRRTAPVRKLVMHRTPELRDSSMKNLPEGR
jgi:hypothetical protein